jgi:hypothetical protein
MEEDDGNILHRILLYEPWSKESDPMKLKPFLSIILP